MTQIDADRDIPKISRKINYTLETIPQTMVKQYFKINCKFKYWGTSVDVTDVWHPENIFSAERIS
jgi:cyanophycin synthetase